MHISIILPIVCIFADSNIVVTLNIGIMKKKINLTSLTIRINDSDPFRCCFDVLANGLELTDGLTFGELIEYLVTVYRDKIFGYGYTTDYPFVSINGIGVK